MLHLVGSAVSPFYDELSRLYAADCLAALPDHEAHVAHVAPDGRWRFPADLSPAAIAVAPPVPLDVAIGVLSAMDVDVAVPQMFCLPGMTHHRALLDLLGIPYLGNRPDVMALGAHKARAKAVVAGAGVRVPDGELLRSGERATLAPPVVVKPVDADNSLGLSLVRDPAELAGAVEAALEHADAVLVERYVELGREVRCGVLERDGELVGLPLEEYDVHAERKPVRGHADKIAQGADGGLQLVAKDSPTAWLVDVDDPVTATVHQAAFACHRAMGCRDYSLFDFRIDADGNPWFLEAGLYCSFARTSVIAVMARAAGIELAELFATTAAAALAR